MCGIAGILKVHDPKDGAPPHPLEAIPEAWLDVLDESIKHRGPDGQGRFRDRALRADGVVVDVAFVHRRLSIIDHAGGHQPMVHDGERLREDLTYQPGETPKLAHELCPASERPKLVAVVFNGCIYNHRELRAELESLGHRFETDHSDTEVLVHAYRQTPEACTDRIDGMHALCLWDRQRGMMRTQRDHAGEKPLYSFCWNDPIYDYGAVASVPAALSHLQAHLGMGRVQADIDELASWCKHGYHHSPPELGLFQHSPGTWYETDLYRMLGDDEPLAVLGEREDSGSRYIRRSREKGTLTPSDIDELLTKSIRSRLTADVPIGCFLSGGIDSGLIAAIAQREAGGLTAITIRMPNAAYDESEAAAETAAHLNIKHEVVECDPYPASDLVRLIEELGLPFGDSSLLPTYWVSQAACERVKVALSGDGADELFGGYERYAIPRWTDPLRYFLAALPTSVLDESDPKSHSSKLARLVRAARGDGYFDVLAIFQKSECERLVPGQTRLPGFGLGFGRSAIDPLSHDFQFYLANDLLTKTDTASMAVALEVRAPFLARELVEAALCTPLSVIMPRGERKGLLKQVARKYLPDHIVDRPKQGFAIPVGAWFRTDYGGMRSLLYDHLESADPFPGLAEAGVEINMGFVRRMLREHDAAGEKSINPWHGRDHSQRLYMVLVLSIWAKWLAGVRAEPVRAEKEPRP